VRGGRLRRGGVAARLAALAASARMEPSSTHCSTSRPSILARSASGSRGARRGRVALTSAARRSAAVSGRRGPSLAPPRGPPGRPRPDEGRPEPERGRPPAARPELDGRPRGVSAPRPPVGRAPPRGASSRGGPGRRVAPRLGGRLAPDPPSRRGGREGRPEDMSIDATAAGRRSVKRRRAPPSGRRPCVAKSGGVLLSQGVYPQVPSALTGLTAVFGMGTGVTLSLWPPKSVVQRCAGHPEDSRASTSCSIQALGRLVPVG
jgi:hypothetical protein